MSKINSSSLFHFTKNLHNLKSIIQNGFRYSYSFELASNDVIESNIWPLDECRNSKLNSNNYGVAIPMVCFCDIPLMRTNEHRYKYGDYVIGIDNKFITEMQNATTNPIFYLSSINVNEAISHFAKNKSDAMKRIWDIVNKISKDELLLNMNDETMSIVKAKYERELTKYYDVNFYADNLIGFSKLYGYKNDKNEFICNYDEREWRSILHDKANDGLNWIWGISKAEFNHGRDIWNKEVEKSENGFMRFNDGVLKKAITHIIVCQEKERLKVIKYLMETKTIFGISDISYEERLYLVSLVNSFERIVSDY